MFPDATVLHLGLFRDKVTLQAIEWVCTARVDTARVIDDRYYSKLPTEVTADLVFVLDRESVSVSLTIANLVPLTSPIRSPCTIAF